MSGHKLRHLERRRVETGTHGDFLGEAGRAVRVHDQQP